MHNPCVHESLLLRLLFVNDQTLDIVCMTSRFLWLLYGLWKIDYHAKNFSFTYVATATLYYNMVVSPCPRCRIVSGLCGFELISSNLACGVAQKYIP